MSSRAIVRLRACQDENSTDGLNHPPVLPASPASVLRVSTYISATIHHTTYSGNPSAKVTSMSVTAVFNILDVLKDRREHCRELLKLSRVQRRLIDDDNFAGLLDVLGRKQRILGSLDALAGPGPNLKQAWHAERESMDESLREECEHVLAETEAIFVELLQEESESTEYLTRRRDSTQRQLQAAAMGPQKQSAKRAAS